MWNSTHRAVFEFKNTHTGKTPSSTTLHQQIRTTLYASALMLLSTAGILRRTALTQHQKKMQWTGHIGISSLTLRHLLKLHLLIPRDRRSKQTRNTLMLQMVARRMTTVLTNRVANGHL